MKKLVFILVVLSILFVGCQPKETRDDGISPLTPPIEPQGPDVTTPPPDETGLDTGLGDVNDDDVAFDPDEVRW